MYARLWLLSPLMLAPSFQCLPLSSLSPPALLLLGAHTAMAYDHVDSRCSCKCPEANFVDPDIHTAWQARKMYINSTVSAADCDCEHVVVPVLHLDREQIDKFCPRCLCSHETRSVTTIKVAVGIILWVLSLLMVYLLYLVCVEPLLGAKSLSVSSVGRGRNGTPYRRHNDETGELDDSTPVTPMADFTNGTGAPGHQGARGVVNRLSTGQERWKKQVEIQRSSVYDRHTLLN